MNESIDAKDSMALLLTSQEHIHENIKFADQKAVALIGINGALLGVLYPLIPATELKPLIAGLIVCILLAAGIGLATWVIRPRGEKNYNRGAGVIDSIRIAQFSLDDFLSQAETISNKDLLLEIRTFIYDRAAIDRKKYFFLKFSLYISLTAWLASLILAGWIKLHF